MIKCEYPYTLITFHDTAGNMMTGAKAHVFLQIMTRSENLITVEDARHLHLDVLYIGQSFGKEGERDAIKRLQNHETLQKIYVEIASREPEKEVWIALPTFQDSFLMMDIDGRNSVETTTTDTEDTTHVNDVIHSGISLQQEINFTEAALIRYFQPHYNTEFKNSFPNPAHTSYSSCYDLDLNAVSVEIQTIETFTHFYSRVVPPCSLHLPKFPLHSRELRVSMFDFE